MNAKGHTTESSPYIFAQEDMREGFWHVSRCKGLPDYWHNWKRVPNIYCSYDENDLVQEISVLSLTTIAIPIFQILAKYKVFYSTFFLHPFHAPALPMKVVYPPAPNP